jgi:hypothetical protein
VTPLETPEGVEIRVTEAVGTPGGDFGVSGFVPGREDLGRVGAPAVLEGPASDKSRGVIDKVRLEF